MWLIATGLVVAATVTVIVLLTRGESDEIVADETTTTVPLETTTTTVPDESTSSTGPVDELTPWLGTLQWTEVARNPATGDRTLVHRLDLDEATAEGIDGRLQQNGFEPATDVAVSAEMIDGVLTVLATPVAGDTTPYVEREVLFRLGGDPAAPSTELAGLLTLLSDIDDTGLYFARGPGTTTVVDVIGETTTSTTDPTSSSSTSSTAEPGPDLSRWLGTFRWTETAGNGGSGDPTVIHQLDLLRFDDDRTALEGRLTQTGLDRTIEVTVVAAPGDDGIVIAVVEDRSEPPFYNDGAVLFGLTGDATRPTTALFDLAVLEPERPATGTYFTR